MIEIQLTWYNIIPILAGVFFLVEIIIAEIEDAKSGGMFLGFPTLMYIIAAAFFYAIWGGVFWW